MSLSKIDIPTVTPTVSEKIVVVQPPASLTQEESRAALSGLISTLGAECADQRSMVELVYNLLYLGIPEMRGKTPSWKSIKVEVVAPSKEEYLTWTGLAEEGQKKVNPNLPTLPSAVHEEACAVTQEGAVYIALASLLFSIGRQASESARASAMDNRPDALIRRFSIKEQDQILLPGRSSGPSREALEQIYSAFANYTEVRLEIMKLFLGIKRGGHHLPIHLEILMTNFHLMRGAGMTHVDAIIKLVKMHPWVLKVPKLEPYFHKFAEELKKFEVIDEDIRPYHRLLVPQGEYLFISSEYRPLIAVAGSFIEEVEKTFNGYVYNRDIYQDLIAEVHGYVPGYQPKKQFSVLAGLLGVKEEPLPLHSKAPTTQEEATV
jgi:hypothetical protein